VGTASKWFRLQPDIESLYLRDEPIERKEIEELTACHELWP
jgi:hypothetical protein